MGERPWYPAAGLDPPRHAGRPVELAGAGFIVRGRLARDPHALVWAWQEWRAAIAEWVLLAPWRRLAMGEIASRREPTAWRPLADEPWPWPLPEPVVSALPAWPRPLPPAEAAAAPDASAPTPAQYSRPGAITRPEAEARVIDALRTVRALPGPLPRGFHGITAWPATLVEWADLIGRERKDPEFAPVPRRSPSPEAIGDLLTALAWFAALKRPGHGDGRRGLTPEQRLIVWRALEPPLSWRAIGDRVGRTHEWVRQRYEVAMDRIWSSANGRGTVSEAGRGRSAPVRNPGAGAGRGRAPAARGHQ